MEPLARLLDGRDDRQLERWCGSSWVQRWLFWQMARAFDSAVAEGFAGAIVYELTCPARGAGSRWWTLDVYGSAAVAAAGVPRSVVPAVTLHVPVADFVRIGAGLIDPAEPLLKGRARLEGDLAVGARIPEMFGAPRPR